jgi:hypothetical protein
MLPPPELLHFPVAVLQPLAQTEYSLLLQAPSLAQIQVWVPWLLQPPWPAWHSSTQALQALPVRQL